MFRQTLILDQIGDLVIMTDLDGNIIYVNDAVCRSLKRTRGELMGSPIVALGEEDIQKEMRKALKSRGKWQGEVVNITSEGERLIMLCHAWVVKNRDGQPYAFCGISKDITRQKEAELALYRREATYREIIENIQDVYYRTDREGRLIMISPSGVELLGYNSAEEMIGKDIAGSFYAVPQEREPLLEELKKNGKINSYDVTLKKKDGTSVYVLSNSHFYFDRDGNKAGVEGVFTDITEHKKATEELKKIEWLLEKEESKRLGESEEYVPFYGNITDLNRERLILDNVGKKTLKLLAADIMDLLDTSLAVYERNGDCAFAMYVSRWCRFLDTESRRLCKTEDNAVAIQSGNWLCHEHCWKGSARKTIRTGKSTDIECVGGIRSYAEPIFACGEIIGCIKIGYTEPPTDREILKKLARKFMVGIEELTYAASEYKPRPPFIIEVAKKKLKTVARLIGEIVERKQIENTLRENEEKYRNYVENAPYGIFICDENGDYLEINQAASIQTGYSRKELISMNILDLAPIEKRGQAQWHFQKLRQDGKAGGEVMFRRKDGSDGVWMISAVKLSPTRYLGFTKNITASKKMELELQRETEAIEASIDGIAILNQQKEYIYLNRAYALMYGYDSPDELIGKNWRILSRDKEIQHFERETLPILNERGHWRGEGTGIKKNGTLFPREISLTSLVDGGLICIVRDISDRKESEKERLELERRFLQSQKLESLGLMAGGIAHDFNNLLTTILGNLDMALSHLSPDSPAQDNLEDALQASKLAADLTRQMLAYSGKGIFKEEPIDLNDLVRENVNILRSSIPKNVDFQLCLGPDIPPISADPGRIQQVVMNLVTNAAESIDDKPGEVVLATRMEDCTRKILEKSWLENKPPPGRFVVLEVSDNGLGMDSNTVLKIFDPFFSTKFPGRGLGLAAVLGIIKACHGAIMVDTKPGEGTSIRIFFPSMIPETDFGKKVMFPRESLEDKLPPGTKILLVDDEVLVLRIGIRMLEKLGAEVLTAENGEEAIRIFQENHKAFTAVILDLSMPRMDGMTAMTELKKIDSGVPVILSSGYSRETVTEQFHDSEPTGFLEKPYRFEQLRAELLRILSPVDKEPARKSNSD